MKTAHTTGVTAALLAALALFLSASAFAQSCALAGAAQIPAGTQWAAGPNVYAQYAANAAVGNDILAGQDAWDATAAADRLAGWNGVITGSDCPAGQPLQVGAFNFATTPCATVSATYPNGTGSALAFVDYFPWVCTQCGTRSISVNMAFLWSVQGDPLPGQYDLRSVLAHEFGHVLGLAHMQAGGCVTTTSPTCAANPGQETMGSTFSTGSGETCKADVAPNDVNSAFGLYGW